MNVAAAKIPNCSRNVRRVNGTQLASSVQIWFQLQLQKGMQNIKSCMPKELYLPGPLIQLQKSTALFFRKTKQI
jgi:hypothetical protein